MMSLSVGQGGGNLCGGVSVQWVSVQGGVCLDSLCLMGVCLGVSVCG